MSSAVESYLEGGGLSGKAAAAGAAPLCSASFVSVPGLFSSRWAVACLSPDTIGLPPITVTYERAMFDHVAISVSLGNVSVPGIGLSGERHFFTPWVEVDWHPYAIGLDGFFVGGATAPTRFVGLRFSRACRSS